jgi:type I restriction enzyme R subunit
MLLNENPSKEDIKKIKIIAVDLFEKIKLKITELDY